MSWRHLCFILTLIQAMDEEVRKLIVTKTYLYSRHRFPAGLANIWGDCLTWFSTMVFSYLSFQNIAPVFHVGRYFLIKAWDVNICDLNIKLQGIWKWKRILDRNIFGNDDLSIKSYFNIITNWWWWWWRWWRWWWFDKHDKQQSLSYASLN